MRAYDTTGTKSLRFYVLLVAVDASRDKEEEEDEEEEGDGTSERVSRNMHVVVLGYWWMMDMGTKGTRGKGTQAAERLVLRVRPRCPADLFEPRTGFGAYENCCR